MIIHTRSGRSSGNGNDSGNNGCSAGCITTLLIIIAVFVIIAIIVNVAGLFDSKSVDSSTVVREKLPEGSVNETEYFNDEINWIFSERNLEKGMEHFYDKTGVQPYLHITDTINGKHYVSNEELAQFTRDLYDKLFTDESHFLVVFFEYNDNYRYFAYPGNKAKSVIDSEAGEIFGNYLERYYYSDYSEEEFFSKTFYDTAERIMTVTKSPWITVFIIFGVAAIVAILFMWWRHHKKQKNLEAEQTEEILKTPIEKFGDTEAEDLAKKYENDNTANKDKNDKNTI